MPHIPSSSPRRLPAAARLGLSAIAAVILTLGAVVPARGQASGSRNSAQAADSSWFKQYHAAAQDTLAPAAYNGWKQFELNCSRCHGENAEGTSFAPSLVKALGPGGPVTNEQTFLKIACNGIPGTGMPAWCTLGLGTDQLQAIYLYVKGRADGTIHPGRPAVRAGPTSATPLR